MKKSYKPRRIIDGYIVRKQLTGFYKVLEYSSMSDGSGSKKRTIAKDLTLSDAENKVYELEKKSRLK